MLSGYPSTKGTNDLDGLDWIASTQMPIVDADSIRGINGHVIKGINGPGLSEQKVQAQP